MIKVIVDRFYFDLFLGSKMINFKRECSMIIYVFYSFLICTLLDDQYQFRFMISCDTCLDWFHGKCVGITKAMGKV